MKQKVKIFNRLWLIAGLAFASTEQSYAQVCAQSDVNTFQATMGSAATCLSNGSINNSVTANAANVQLKFTQTPPGVTLSGVYSPGVQIGSLKAGTYTLRAYCINNENVYKDQTVVIPNQYTPITASANVNVNCSNGMPNALITTNVVGGSGTLQYAYWQGASNQSDNNLTYTNSATFVPPTYGVYNIRVKDACGEAVTIQASVASPYPDDLELVYVYPWTHGSLPCSTANYSLYVELTSNGVTYSKDGFPASGVLFQVYEGPCNSSSLIHLPSYDSVLTPNSESNDILIPANKQLVIKAITPCGDTTSICYDGTTNGQPAINDFYRQMGCQSSALNTVTGVYSLNEFSSLPFSYSIKNDLNNDTIQSGSNEWGRVFVANLAYGATYTFTVTDPCGRTFSKTKTIQNQSGAGTEVQAVFRENNLRCANQAGRYNVDINITGYIPGLDDANTRVRIIAPESVNQVGEQWKNPDFIRFFNLLPGTTYTAVIEKANSAIIDSGVCQNDTVTFYTPSWGTTLKQSITGTVSQNCSGGGDISLTTDYTGWNSNLLQLRNAISGALIGNVVGGGSAVYTNLAPGKYFGELVIASTCTNSPDTLIIATDTLIISGANAGPQINKKIGVICENSNGTALTSGNAYFNFTGAAPFIVEYKKVSDANFTMFNNNWQDDEFTLLNLEANQVYSIRITDVCGNITNSNIEILTLEPLSMESAEQPCLGANFTLSVPDYGDATYLWKKNNVTIATTREYLIPNFSISDAGTYRCEVVIAGCLSRIMDVTLYSQMCAQPITNYNVTGTVFNDGNGLTDGKVNGIGTNVNEALYAILLDGNNKVLASVPVASNGTYDFSNVPAGSYKVAINNGQPIDGSILTTTTLTNNWLNTGENHNLPTVSGNDGTVDGLLSFTLSNADVMNLNFGIEQRPQSVNKLKEVPGAPVVGVAVNLGDVPMAGSDPEDQVTTVDWNNKHLIITNLPTDNFILKYEGQVIQAGDTIKNYNPALLTIEPSATTPEGTLNTVFLYATLDNANALDLTPATYTVTWSVPLPIEFSKFNVVPNGCTNEIHCTIKDNIRKELKTINVERETENGTYVTIGTLNKNGVFEDQSLLGHKSNYRLVAVNLDGSAIYSEVKTVENMCDKVGITVHPNPASHQLTITRGALNGTAQYSICNLLGAELLKGNWSTQKINISLSEIPAGHYFLTVTDNGSTIVNKITVAK